MDPSRLVVGVDGWDTLLSRAATPQEFAARFSYFGTEFLWSCEINMFPNFQLLPPHVRQNYPSFWPNDTSVPERWRGVQKRVPYPFLNYGGWVGTAGRAALVMKTIADMLQCTPVPQPKPEEGKDPPIPACPWHDQHAAQLVLVSDVCRSPGDEGAKCALDNFGEVFYSGFPMCGGLKPRIDGDWWNADAGVTPLTVHLNGMAKGGCAKAGFIERMTSKRTAWFHRVNVSAQAPVLVTRASFHGNGLMETHAHSFGELCPDTR